MINLLTSVKSITDTEPLSITQQGWDVKLVDFRAGIQQDTVYFNPSLVALPDRDWLIVRRSKYDPEIQVGRNDLVAFGLDSNWLPQVGVPLKPFTLRHEEHQEDGRTFFYKGQTYVSACCFIWFKGKNMWSGAHQSAFAFDRNWKCAGRWEPVYGNNTEGLGAPKGHEKNWLFFPHQDRLMLLYNSEPWRIAEFDWQTFKALREWQTEPPAWDYGHIRGGSNPQIGPDGLYWTFFHSSRDKQIKNQKRRYYVGCIAFEPKEPFKVVKITKEPLLVGSINDPWDYSRPACVFPGSAIIRKGIWHVAFGVNDIASAIGHFPHSEISSRCHSVA